VTEQPGVEEPPPDDPETPPEPVKRARIWPRVVGVLILVLGVAGALIWQKPEFIQNSLASLFPGSTSQKANAAAIEALEARVARLETQPSTADLAVRLSALERRAPAQNVSQPPVDLRPLQARLDALESRTKESTRTSAPSVGGGDIGSVPARLDELVADRNADASRIAAIQAQIATLSANEPADLSGKLTDLAHQVDELAAHQTKLAEASDHAVRLARLDAAQFALASGRPVGPVPDAPPALARFATTAPPTEAGLRLTFNAASQEALKVSQPDTEDKPFLDRVMARLQDSRLITVREGDRVVVGNSTAAALLRARTLLDAGDLAGSVKTVSTLTGPPAEKMAAWLAEAKSLQEAREALAALAGNG
jgi:hypothetical protein